MEERSAEMGVLAVRIAVLVFSGPSKAPCGVEGDSTGEGITGELEWLSSEIGLAIVSDEMGDTLGSWSCTSCCPSSTRTPSLVGIGDCREIGVSSPDLWLLLWSSSFSAVCIAGISSVSMSHSGIGDGGKAIKAGVIGLVFETSEVDAETF